MDLENFQDFDENTRFARYDEFYIENENALYKLSKLGTYTGDAGDAFYTKNQAFSTCDKNNDASETKNCAIERRGAWWYEVCTRSNLFGTYYVGEYSNQWADTGLTWELWRGRYYSYKAMKMLIRPKYICL